MGTSSAHATAERDRGFVADPGWCDAPQPAWLRDASATPQPAETEERGAVEWLATRRALRVAEARWRDPATRTRLLLVVCGSAGRTGAGADDAAETARLTREAGEILQAADVDVDVLDLGHHDLRREARTQPCKGCVAAAMPRCHFPCTCAGRAAGLVDDRMNEVCERWTAAHGVLMIAPAHRQRAPAVLQQLIERLACLHVGPSDPSLRSVADVAGAAGSHPQGWPSPKHLAGRAFGLLVHGDVDGVLQVRRSLTDWLDWMGLVDAAEQARLDHFIGCDEACDIHRAMQRCEPSSQDEVRNVVQALLQAVMEIRAGRLLATAGLLKRARPS